MSKKEQPTYTTFYRVMLILSTIGTSFGVLGTLSLPELLASREHAPLYVACLLIMHAVTLVSIAALVMLWQKKYMGYLLKLSTYAVLIIACVVALFGVDAYSQYSVDQSLTQLANEGISDSQIEQITRTVVPFFIKASVVLGIIQAAVFAILWRAAWKKQLAYDKENS